MQTKFAKGDRVRYSSWSGRSPGGTVTKVEVKTRAASAVYSVRWDDDEKGKYYQNELELIK